MPIAETLFVIASYAIGINLAGFLAFACDRHCARNGMWRVPEQTLLTLAAVGGTVGVIFGQRVMRHKTWKQPFRAYLLSIAVIQVIALSALGIWQVRYDLRAFSRQMASPQALSPQAKPRQTSGQTPPPRIIRH